jgi:hypothetical protein
MTRPEARRKNRSKQLGYLCCELLAVFDLDDRDAYPLELAARNMNRLETTMRASPNVAHNFT